MVKKIMGIGALIILLMGCSSPNHQTQKMNKNDIITIPSTITVKVDDKDFNIPLTNYSIIEHKSNGVVGTSNPNDLATKTNKFATPSYKTFTPNSVVKIEKIIKNQPEISGTYFNKQNNKQGDLPLKHDTFKLPSQKGQYEYRIHTIWTNCKATYTLLVKIK